MAPNETYRLLPDGPVLCDTCERTGESIEMEREDALPADALRWSEEQDVELQSFRCPECEAVKVFRVD